MKVKATKLGYYGHKRRREGEQFELADKEDFSERWMEKAHKGDDLPLPMHHLNVKDPKKSRVQKPKTEVVHTSTGDSVVAPDGDASVI